ncbi:MAG: hypothetical protein ACK4NP_13445 [Parvularculaceae bacterium]
MSIAQAVDPSPYLAAAVNSREPAPREVQVAAEEFEAAFISEMLSYAGLDAALAARSGFGGESMASFLIAEISRQIAAQQTFGVADLVTRNLSRQA